MPLPILLLRKRKLRHSLGRPSRSDFVQFKLVDPTEVFVDATHVKARANNKKMQKRIAHEEALFYEELLQKEINEDREAHGKRPLKEKNDKDDDDNDSTPSTGGDP